MLDGAATVGKLVAKAKELGMDALALTDHGVMYGVIEFYQACKKAGIKPIIGCEVYLAQGSRFVKNAQEHNSHLLLIAENETGYKNLMKLVTRAYLDGYYYRPRIDKEILKDHSDGLIALSACLGGEVPQAIMRNNGDPAEAISKIREYQEIFGPDNFFLELMDQGMPEQKQVNDVLIKLSREHGFPLVVTNDVHYPEREDATAQEVLICIATGKTLEDAKRMRFHGDEYFMRSEEELRELFPGVPEAFENSSRIAERATVEIEFDKIYLPKIHVPVEEKLTSEETPEAEKKNIDHYFEKLCWDGLRERFGQPTPEYEERLRYEIDVINRIGYSAYFLIVSDFIEHAKKDGVLVGPGRGSAAGSLVAYCLHITELDPLKYGLLFERFLNPDRVSMPDIDIDFADKKRDRVIEYVAEKHGRDNVAQIITFSKMAAKAAIRDAGRVLGYSYGDTDRVAKLVPDAIGMTLEQALVPGTELRGDYDVNPDTRTIVDHAKKLEGLSRQDSIHAAGVVISANELTEHVPLQKKGDGEVVTQYDMKSVEKIGLLKFDFLGIRYLTVIEDALKLIEENRGVKIDVNALPLDDAKTYEQLRKGLSYAVFQLDSAGMQRTMKDLKPTTFTDLVALLALYRTGPLQSGMTQDYIDRKNGLKQVEYWHPSLEPILKETYGTMIYQEQIMQVAVELCGFTLSQSDTLRRAIGKKDAELLDAQRASFVDGAVNRSIDQRLATDIFEKIRYFSEYGFNKSHSAAYAMISYQTAYLKTHYPVEYMAAVISSNLNDKDKILLYINEVNRMGIKILPPDINESGTEVTVHGDSILLPLSMIRNVGENLVLTIMETRKTGGKFKGLFDLCTRVESTALNKRSVESLIKGGAFDALSPSRLYLLERMENAMAEGSAKQKDKLKGQTSIFDLDAGAPDAQAPEVRPDVYPEMAKHELLEAEKEMLGLYLTEHPLSGKETLLVKESTHSIRELKELEDGQQASLVGIVAKAKKKMTRKNELMMFLQFEDLTDTFEVIVFPKTVKDYRDLLVEDKILKITGRLDKKESEPKFRASEFKDLTEEANRLVEEDTDGKLTLIIPVHCLNLQVLSALPKIFKEYPGTHPVYVNLVDGNVVTRLQLGRSFCVSGHSGLFAELKGLLGSDCIDHRNSRVKVSA